jgi:hypothetical protein
MMPILSLDRAAVSRCSDGSVRFDDPGCPLVVTLRVESGGGRPRVASIRVDARDTTRITSKALSRLPIPQMLHLAALSQSSTHPNETHWRSMVRPKAYGKRGWPPEHWQLVWDVYRWAAETNRAGGAVQAVADLWCVSTRPTAYRWVARARREVSAEPR